jgi:hypothetical protein
MHLVEDASGLLYGRHSREGGNPVFSRHLVPACAGIKSGGNPWSI